MIKYDDLQVGKIYTYLGKVYILIIEKNNKKFYYYKYNNITEKWAIGGDTFINYHEAGYIWHTIELAKINEIVSHEMVKNLFKNEIRKETEE